jgi:hypothetical protein
MKAEFRRELAQQSFEEKIHKVGALIQLSRKIKARRVREDTQSCPVSDIQCPLSSQLPPKDSKK